MHFGHLNLIDFFIKKTDLDEIWIIITPLNPFKSKCLTTKEKRFKMVELSLSNKKDVKISKIEFLLDKPNYTINTLRELSEKYPENKFVLLIGEDNLYRFNKWKNYQEILESYMLYVYPRKTDFPIPEYIKTHPSIKFLKAPKIKNSSSQIRKKIAKNINVTNFIHPKVYQYIKENKIYIK